MAEKIHMNLVTVGHVDHGKSTTVGRLLYDTGNVTEEQMRKLKEKAAELKKESFEFAFVMDSLKEEQQRGVTIDVAHKRFDTEKYYFTVIDAPGHRDFVKNMITGASQADAAIVVCSAKDGPQAQTKEHIYLCKILGVDQVIISLNKMDEVGYDEAKYKQAKEDVSKILLSIGYKPDTITFVPASAFKGDNIAKKSENMAWYTGPTLVEALDQLNPPEQPTDKALRMPIQDVYSITGIGTVPVGRVETGILKKGQKVVFAPSGATGEVKSIEMHHEDVNEAPAGSNVGVSVRGVDKNAIKRGDVMCSEDAPAKAAKSFKAQIIVLNHPNVITKGYTPVFHCHTAQIACKIEAIEKKINPKTGETVEENPDFIKTGDAAIVKVVPAKPLIIEDNKTFPEMARFAIRDMGQTVAAGVCLEVEN